MDRASTIRFYDHYGHASAAVCYQNTLHARTGDGRLDHARTHEPRGRKGVKVLYNRRVIAPAEHVTGHVIANLNMKKCDYMPSYMLRRRDYTIVIALGYYMLNYKQSIV